MEYVTKDSWEKQSFPTGMQRNVSTWKPRFDLLILDDIPFKDQPLTLFAELLERGAKIYGDRNWEKASTVEEYNRFKESLIRHVLQAVCGEIDEDHKSAAMFNLFWMFLVEYRMGYKQTTSPAK